MMFASFLHCVRVSGRLSKCICNARKWLCLAQSEQGRQQSPLVQQGMSHLKYITTRLFCLWHVLPASPHLFPQSDKTFHPIRSTCSLRPATAPPFLAAGKALPALATPGHAAATAGMCAGVVDVPARRLQAAVASAGSRRPQIQTHTKTPVL